MAWIVVVPPSPRHPHERYQVCYQQGKRRRSAGIFPTKRRALAEKRAVERGRDELLKAHDVDLERTQTLFGDYVATKWWPAWKDQHPPPNTAPAKRSRSGSCRLRRHPPRGPGRQHDWRLEVGHAGRTALTADGEHLPVTAGDHPQRRRRRRLPGPLPPGAQERRRPRRRHPQPARPPPRGLATARAARPPRRGDRPPLPRPRPGRRPDRHALGSWSPSVGTTPASTSRWTTVLCAGRGGCGSPGRSATPAEPAGGWRRVPRPKPASG
jgi:hypothetical protein